MSADVIVAVAAVVTGIGGALVTLVAWGRERRSRPRQAKAGIVPPRASSRQHLAIPIGIALAFPVILIAIAVIPAIIRPPAHRPQPKSESGTSVTPTAVLSNRNSRGVEDVAFSSTGTVLATADLNGSFYLWDLATGRNFATVADGSSKGVGAVAFNGGTSTLAVGDRNGSINLWQVSDPAHPIKLAIFHCPGINSLAALAFGRNGELAIGGVQPGPVCVAEPTTGRIIAHLPAGGWATTSIAFSPNGKLLAVGTVSGRVFLWNAVTDKLIGEPLATGSGTVRAVSSLAFSPDGGLLAIGDFFSQTQLWKVTDSSHPVPFATFNGPTSQSVLSVAFSPDGTVLALAGANGKTYLWEVALPKLIGVLADPASEGVSSVTFSPNGKLIATADLNGHTFLWKSPSL